MADSILQLPYTGTTSGDLLDVSLITVGANAVKRERMVIVDDTATANFAAVVTTSGALSVARTPTSLTSGLVTLSSAPSISSGVITLSSDIGVSSGLITLTGLNTVTLSSNPVASQIVSLSSGTVTLSSAIAISSGTITLSSNPVTGQSVSLSSGTVTLSSDPTIVSASSGVVQVLTTGTYLVNATSTSGLLVDVSRGVTLNFFNLTATSSGLKSLVAASGSNKIKLISYVLVSQSTQEIAFYSSNTALGGTSSAGILLSSYSGISAVGDRTSWLMETSAAGSLQIYLSNAGVVAGHGAYIYEV